VIQLKWPSRLAAQPGNKDYGYLSVATQFYTRPEFVLKLPPGAFSPPPEVASALVTLRLPGPRRADRCRADAGRVFGFCEVLLWAEAKNAFEQSPPKSQSRSVFGNF